VDKHTHPIGILDSGLGGLTIWKEIVAQLPHESTLYIGDSLHAPYGARSSEEIYQLSKRLVKFLLSKDVKAIVVACNTITVSCLDKLRNDFPEIAIIGTVPVVKTAAAASNNKRIGVLSTTRTAQSEYQKELIESFAKECHVTNYGSDELVPLIERGELSGEQLEETVSRILAVFKKDQIDTLALGCTHFPFLRKQMQDILGPDVVILDSGPSIARQVTRVLEEHKTLAVQAQAKHQFYTTGDETLANKLLQATIATLEGAKQGQFQKTTI
jgi:glutamate racemase